MFRKNRSVHEAHHYLEGVLLCSGGLMSIQSCRSWYPGQTYGYPRPLFKLRYMEEYNLPKFRPSSLSSTEYMLTEQEADWKAEERKKVQSIVS